MTKEIYARRQANIYWWSYTVVGVIILLILLLFTSGLGALGLFLVVYTSSGMIGWFLRVRKKYQRWEKGATGEETVAYYLSILEPTYKIYNDLLLPDAKGNIDHLVVGKGGIFVIETKYFTGKIYCEKDEWYRKQGDDRVFLKSPSLQVKSGCVRLKNFIDDRGHFQNLWVQGIVMMANDDCIIESHEETVPILRNYQIAAFIKKRKTIFSRQDIKQVQKIIEMELKNAPAGI